MSGLRSALEDYLSVRRQLGFELEKDGRLLEDFVGFLERSGAERITTELALIWAKLPAESQPLWWRQRLGMVRGFARYLFTIDPVGEVPPNDLLPARQERVAPYLYSQTEIAALMGAARALTPTLRAATYETLIGLLAVSGLRPGEALGLDRGDVDLRDGALHVRAAKHNKQREVPLHDSTTTALQNYSRLRDQQQPKPDTAAFFVSAQGTRLPHVTFNRTFSKLILHAGLEGRGKRQRPRPHDIRHSFAVRTLLEWHRAGEDVDRRLPLLSTFLGHAGPASTYWYLETSPELLALVARRLDGVLGERP
jgi:integrase